MGKQIFIYATPQEACSIAAGAGRPVWFEPVSASKAVRATRVLGALSYVSPNQAELLAMAEALWAQEQQQQQQQHEQQSRGRPGSSDERSMQPPGLLAGHGGTKPAEGQLRALRPHLAAVLGAGTRHVVLTLGTQGAALCTLSVDRQSIEATLLPAAPAAEVINCSGAGDALVAGACFGLLEGRRPAEALALGVAAAALTVQSSSNIPPGLGAKALAGAAGAVLREARSLRLRCDHPLTAQSTSQRNAT